MDQILSYLTSTYLSPPTAKAFSSYLIYYAYICLASILLPSKSVKGHPNPKRGPQLTYTINGFRLTILTIVLILVFGGVFPKLNQVKVFSVSSLAS